MRIALRLYLGKRMVPPCTDSLQTWGRGIVQRNDESNKNHIPSSSSSSVVYLAPSLFSRVLLAVQ